MYSSAEQLTSLAFVTSYKYKKMMTFDGLIQNEDSQRSDSELSPKNKTQHYDVT